METEISLDRRWGNAIDALRTGDKAGALYIFKSMAKEGEVAAFREIASILEFGDGGVEKDIGKAIHWYRKAVEIANDGHGCVGLARIYFYGKTGNPDYRKALGYLLEIEKNNLPLANLMLGRIYQSDKQGLEPDFNKAKEYYEKSAQTGNVYAIKELGVLEVRRKHYITGVILWLKGFFMAITIGARDSYDPRLKGF